jgi:hypothetical protein
VLCEKFHKQQFSASGRGIAGSQKILAPRIWRILRILWIEDNLAGFSWPKTWENRQTMHLAKGEESS